MNVKCYLCVFNYKTVNAWRNPNGCLAIYLDNHVAVISKRQNFRGSFGFRLIWKEFQLLSVMTFKWYPRHLFGFWLSQLSRLTSLSAVPLYFGQTDKNWPKPRTNLVTEMLERWPSSSCFWVHSLCQKRKKNGIQGKMSVRKNNKQCQSLTSFSDTNNLISVCKSVTK